MPKTLLYNAGIVTMDAERRQYNNGAILVDGDRIEAVGRSADLLASAAEEVEKIDLSGRWLLPGLINTHVHTSQQLGRGLADDVDLLTWLRGRVWPYESNLTEEDSYISSLLCGLELIRSGVTCFAEAGGQHVAGMGRAVTELGLRAALARSSMDAGEGLPAVWQETTEQVLEAQIANYERWHGQANGRIRAWFGLRTIFNNSDDLIVRTKELADQYGVSIHMHVAEVKEEVEYTLLKFDKSTVYHLHDLDVLDHNLLAAHCVWLTDGEIKHLAEHGVKVTHNPAAAMRVLGFARIPEMLEAGICVTLGTDGAPCNNRMTLVDEMWLATLIHKGRKLDPTVVPAQTVLEMVTCRAAEALLWQEAIGSLEAGKKADLVVIDPNTPTMLPMHDPVANMVNAMQNRNIDSVMCDGQWLMRQGEILVVDETEVMAEAKARALAIAERAGLKLPSRFKVIE